MMYILHLINAYLRTWGDIFKILFKHNRFGIWTDEVNFKSSNLRGRKINLIYDCLGGVAFTATKMPESCPFLFTTEYLLAQQLTQQEQGCQGAVILPMVSKNISAKQYTQLNNKNDLEKTQLFFPSPTFFLPVILVQRSYGWQTILKPLRNKLGGKKLGILGF